MSGGNATSASPAGEPAVFKINGSHCQIPEEQYAELSAGKRAEADIQVKNRDGGWKWLHSVGIFVGTRQGRPLCYTALFDMPEPVVTERQWQEERYRILSESKDVITFDYNPDADTFAYTLNTMQGQISNTSIQHYLAHFPQDKTIHPDSVSLYLEAPDQGEEFL